MSDKLDERLAADVAKLFSGEDMEAAAANFAAAQARARRKHRLAASVGSLALIAATVAATAALRDGSSQPLTVGDSPATGPSVSSLSPSPTATTDLPSRVPLADNVEGKVFGGRFVAVTGDRLPRTEESPGLPRVSLTFYQGTVTWDNGCYALTGRYELGSVPLELTFPGSDRMVKPAVGCTDQEMVNVLDEIVLADPARLSLEKDPSAGLQLSVSGGPGTLNLKQQPYSPSSVSCVPGVDTSVDVTLAGAADKPRYPVGYSDPVHAVIVQVAGNLDVHQQLELALTLSDGTQALVAGTKDGRPVLSAVLDATGDVWNVTRYVTCAADSPTTSAPEPQAATVTTQP